MTKVVLITGANRGIGLSTAKLLTESGYIVYASSRRTSNCSDLDTEISRQRNLKKVILDVTDEDSIRSAVQKIINDEKKLDILINNACDVVVGTVETCSIEQQKKSMDANYFGAVRMIQSVLPQMRKQRSGHIINISSISGIDPYPPIETYTATKFALEGLTESMATNLSPWNIFVSLIEPGGVKTSATEKAAQGNVELKNNPYLLYSKLAQELMIKSYDEGAMEPEEVSRVILGCIEEATPKLRYQVGDFANKIAKDRFKDPTGNRPIIEKRKMLKELGLLDRIDTH